MVRIARELKTEKGIDIPKEVLRNMPSTFRRREAVLWDKKKQNFLMGNVRGSFVTSGSRVQVDALKDAKTYESVEGRIDR